LPILVFFHSHIPSQSPRRRLFQVARPASKPMGNRMISIRLTYAIAHHLGMTGTNASTIIGNQINSFYSIITEALKMVPD